MSSFVSLSSAFLLALSVSRTSAQAQVPANAPACVHTCANVKVSEGYCTTLSIFATAFDQCLKDNCNAADAATGLQYSNSICGGNGTPVSSAVSPGPSAAAPLPTAVPTTPGNVTGNATDYGTTVTNALRAAGLGTLATVLSSPAGASFVSQLQQGPHSVFAPSDSALAAVPLNSTSPADLNALLSYHAVPGTLDVSKLPPNGHAIVRTSLKGAPYVNLPANDSQVLVLAAQPNGVLEIIEPTKNITASNSTRVGNLELTTIQNLLTMPGAIGTTAASVPELSSLVAAINGSAPQLFGELDQTPGLTIFAPINSVFSGAQVNPNFQSILLNHIVNGTVLYSTVIANVTSATSAGGAHIDFTSNGTGVYARSADKTVQIVQSDIITRNGVIHLVNGLFNPSNSTPTFPLVNQNNTSETVGITQVEGANNTSTAAQNAQNSPAGRAYPSSNFMGLVMTAGLIGPLISFV